MSEQRKIYLVLLFLAGVAGFVGYSGLTMVGWDGLGEERRDLERGDRALVLDHRLGAERRDVLDPGRGLELAHELGEGLVVHGAPVDLELELGRA